MKDDDKGLFWNGRRYDANSFGIWLDSFFNTGVGRDDFIVTPGTGMSVIVSPGAACIKGKVNIFEEQELEIEAATSTSRTDLVVVERNNDNREITLKVVKGATTPVRTDTVYQLVVASVSVAASATSVTVTDTRSDSSLCGFIVQPMQAIAWGNKVPNSIEKNRAYFQIDRYYKRILSLSDCTLIAETETILTVPTPTYKAETVNLEASEEAGLIFWSPNSTTFYLTAGILIQRPTDVAVLIKKSLYETEAIAKTITKSVGGTVYTFQAAIDAVYTDADTNGHGEYVGVTWTDNSQDARLYILKSFYEEGTGYEAPLYRRINQLTRSDKGWFDNSIRVEITSIASDGKFTCVLYHDDKVVTFNDVIKTKTATYRVPDYSPRNSYTGTCVPDNFITPEDDIRDLALAINSSLTIDEQTAVRTAINNFAETGEIAVNERGEFTLTYLTELSYSKYVDGVLKDAQIIETYTADDFLPEITAIIDLEGT